MSDKPPTITARREFCYRWTCPACNHTNLESDDVKLGDDFSCARCSCNRIVDMIVYDNGCIMESKAGATDDIESGL